MTEPLNININKSFVLYGGKVFASFENGWGVTVQVYEGETLLTQQEMTYAEYVALQKEALPVPLPDYPDPRQNRSPGGTNANGNTIGRVVGETAPAGVPATQANPPIKTETDAEKGWWDSASPWFHGGLDALEFVPGLGAIPDLINAGIYAVEGDAVNASLSTVAAIPFVGDAIKGGVLVGKGAHSLGSEAAQQVVQKAAKELSERTEKETLEKLARQPELPKAKDGAKIKSDIVTDGSHLQKGGKLKPDIKYRTGEHQYLYETDNLGRITKFTTEDLKLTTRTTRLPHSSNTPGKRAKDHAGHLSGDRFGGSAKLDNLVSQSRKANLSDFAKLEHKWAQAIKEGKKVSTEIKPNYTGKDGRPSSFTVKYSIDGKIVIKEFQN
ncbi:DNA/RNA non-specific endonuclease [Pseudomonas sp. 13B_2.1_Bac1]|uniref:DNA/RNA non-specific endonuclease n=1 Tax=Pseudomonas sp. 13B_2.1_Bac1 TaxID=2971624 RepID=UPI0021C6640C|nr:DNA/RNA non-specific endonuclease [Pseudomonas sp. 13B_2.1_Bac1]MCU1781219.1 DNA/RNA non-specific endonuclease [Pseudomonas sp. 13B_2.1_Bac1]